MKISTSSRVVTPIKMSPPEMIKRVQYPVFVEWKLDGEFNELGCEGPNSGYSIPDLTNKNGKVRYNLPVTDAFKGMRCKVLGELHWDDGKNGALYDLLSHKDSDLLRFTMFDCLEYEGQPIRTDSLLLRRNCLIDIMQRIQANTFVRLSKAVWCENIDEINECIEQNKAEGYEGVVIKPANSIFDNGYNWIKIKHTATIDLKVHKIDPSLERIEVVCPPVNPTDFYHPICGVKCSNRVKATLKVGDIVEIKHYGVLSGGGLRHPSLVRVRHDKTEPSYV